MKAIKTLLYLVAFCLFLPVAAQINTVGFDRYQIMDNDFIVGYRVDSFFVISKSGYLKFSGKGVPVNAINFDFLIFSRGNAMGVIESRIFEPDTMLFPPVYTSIVVESEFMLALTERLGKTRWFDFNSRALMSEKPQMSLHRQDAFTGSEGRGDPDEDGESGLLNDQDTFRSQHGVLYYRGPFKGSPYAICQNGGYLGLSTTSGRDFHEVLPCRYNKFTVLYDNDYYTGKRLILFQADTGYVISWVVDLMGARPLVADSLELGNRLHDEQEICYFSQRNNVTYIKRHAELWPLVSVSPYVPLFSSSTWFFQTADRTFITPSKAVSNQQNLMKPVLLLDKKFVFSGWTEKAGSPAAPVYFIFKNGAFSEPIIDYTLKKDSAGSDYLFYRYVSSPDTIRIDMGWYTHSVENGVYELLDNDNFSRRNPDGTWDVVRLDRNSYSVKVKSLPDLPVPCSMIQGKGRWGMGFRVHTSDSVYALYNGDNKCFHTRVRRPGFNNISGIFTGEDSAGAFLAMGGLDAGEHLYHLHPGETVVHNPAYVQLNYQGKLGYYGYINRLVIPPRFDEFKFHKNILIAREGNRYYFYETGIIN